MIIDCTLSKLVIPGFPEIVPEFGTKKADGVSSTAREATINAMLPFARQRPFPVTEDSGTSEVQAHTPFVIQTGGVTLTLGDGGFVGCKVRVFNRSGGDAAVVFGAGDGFTAALADDEDVRLEWSGRAWKNVNMSNNGGGTGGGGTGGGDIPPVDPHNLAYTFLGHEVASASDVSQIIEQVHHIIQSGNIDNLNLGDYFALASI
jgi:hypothetical protein